ncbi:MAG: hypothetical protein HW408_275 [Actinobacteria bacterium]|nr:hypothetical protein [Actinomycetota bacterium]
MASDAFTNTDGTALSTHNANWGQLGGYVLADLTIVSNQVRIAAWGESGARYTASSIDLSQAVQEAVSEVNHHTHVCVRASASVKGYHFKLLEISGGNWTTLTAYKDGAWLGATTVSISAGVTHTLKITASGTSTVTIKCYVDNTEYLSLTDSATPLGTGNPGFILDGESIEAKADDWTDGAAGGGGAAAVFMHHQNMMAGN